MTSLLLVPLDDTVVFPTMDVTLPVDVGDEERVLLDPAPRRTSSPRSGTIAEVTDRVRLPGGARAVALSGVSRGVAGAAQRRPRRPPARRGDEQRRRRPRRRPHPRRSSASTARSSRRSSSCAAPTTRVGAFLRAIAEPGPLADTIGYAPDVTFEQKVELLETLDVTERLELAVRIQRERLTELQLRRKIRDDVESGADKQQREYFLRKQMESIRRELGEDSALGRRGVPHQDRRGRHARGRRGAGRASSAASSAWASSPARVDDPHLPGLADRRAVERALRGACSTRSPRARCSTPTTPASRTSRTASSSTSRCKKLREERGIAERQAVRRDPDADRPARHRQDLDRRVDRPRDRAASSCACRSAASATRPRSAATAAPTSARSRAASCARCATPGR